MVGVLVDTSILIDYLNRVPPAIAELSRHPGAAISSIGWIEVMVGATPASEVGTRAFLDRFEIVPLDGAVSERAVRLRRVYRLKVPDAISLASAQVTGRLFVTRDAKDFAKIDPTIRIPYKL
ncbi:MAG: type II toxin-antitoxin system VapC family toxin [Rhizomicrobium sp.]